MKLFKVLLAFAILSGSLMSVSKATPAYSKKEGKKCTYCHTAAGKPDLNDTGKCYKENNHSLDKCKAPAGQ